MSFKGCQIFSLRFIFICCCAACSVGLHQCLPAPPVFLLRTISFSADWKVSIIWRRAWRLDCPLVGVYCIHYSLTCFVRTAPSITCCQFQMSLLRVGLVNCPATCNHRTHHVLSDDSIWARWAWGASGPLCVWNKWMPGNIYESIRTCLHTPGPGTGDQNCGFDQVFLVFLLAVLWRTSGSLSKNFQVTE